MISSKNRIILDCTLRDGGYVNNWEFDTETALCVRDALYESGVRFIELGIMGKGGIPGKQTKFATFAEVEPLLAGRKPDCRYCVMVTQAEYASLDERFPACGANTVDTIRLAYFKPEAEAALETAAELKKNGYQVFMQPMATFMYQPEELAAHIDRINALKPTACYMVDSFSMMYNDDVRSMQQFMLERLDKAIFFGFHAHNNIQMAFSNAITFIEHPEERCLVIDGSIFGMGRGAGNVPTELLMEYMKKKMGAAFDIERLLAVFEARLEPVFKENYWGYSLPYYLTASKNMNSVYGWYLNRKGVKGLAEINRILDRIPEEAKYTLMRRVADQTIEAYFEEKKHEQGNV